MGADKYITTRRSLTAGLSRMMNLINEDVQDHHQKVAYLSYRLAEEMGLPEESRQLALMGGLMHDIGSVMLRGEPDLCEIESHSVQMAQLGSRLLKHLPITAPIADIVRYSQSAFGGAKTLLSAQAVAQVVHLADVITLLFNQEDSVLNQLAEVREQIGCAAPQHFHSKAMAAFDSLCRRESVWMDMLYNPDAFLKFIPDNEHVTLGELHAAAKFASIIIDFRSPFTAMHSAGVSATAVELARRIGMSEDECMMMEIAGNLHDIGKLKVPNEILEKPGKLTDEEFNIMKEHAYYTYSTLSGIEGLEEITAWAAFHHEKLGGSGYPFHLSNEDIPFGSRVMAVADIFSAISEDRPYRKGMEPERVRSVLREGVERGELSATVVDLLLDNFDEIDAARSRASRIAGKRYYDSLEKAQTD